MRMFVRCKAGEESARKLMDRAVVIWRARVGRESPVDYGQECGGVVMAWMMSPHVLMASDVVGKKLGEFKGRSRGAASNAARGGWRSFTLDASRMRTPANIVHALGSAGAVNIACFGLSRQTVISSRICEIGVIETMNANVVVRMISQQLSNR